MSESVHETSWPVNVATPTTTNDTMLVVELGSVDSGGDILLLHGFAWHLHLHHEAG